MKIICLQEKLKEAFSVTERIIGKNVNLPILANILIQVEKNHIQVCSTDLELALLYSLPGKIEEEGKIAVPAKLISSFVSNLTAKKITLESKKYNVLVKTEDYKAQILGMNPEDFPIIPQIKKEFSFKVSASLLVKQLEKVVKSVGTSEIRPEITGVLFKNNANDRLILASTDSFRLSETSIPAKSIPSDLSFILPLKAVSETLRIFGNISDVDELTFSLESKNQVLIEGGAVQLISRLIDGEFPNYSVIVPQNFRFTATLPLKTLSSKIKAVSSFSARSNDLLLTFTKNKLELSARDASSGEGMAVLEIPPASFSQNAPSFEPLSIVFNWRFFLDGLESIDSDTVSIGITSEVEPARIKSPTDDPSFFYVLMPIKGS